MIDAYVPPDELAPDNDLTPASQPNRRILYVWLLAGLCLFLALAIFGYLSQNMPEARPNNTRLKRIERIHRSHQCGDNEIVVVTEFAPGLYKAYCVAKG